MKPSKTHKADSKTRRLFACVATGLFACNAYAQTYSRTETVVHIDDTAAWVLGQVESKSVTGFMQGNAVATVETDRTVFNSRFLPWQIFRFGNLEQTLTYNADGTLATVTDGNGNYDGFELETRHSTSDHGSRFDRPIGRRQRCRRRHVSYQ